MHSTYHSGFVSLIGRTNVGKSTLLNQLVGEKISIVSERPQTTRNQIQCILSRVDGQAIFIDTPGMHKPKTRLGERMNQYASQTLPEVDLILFLTTADSMSVGTGDRMIIERLRQVRTPVFLVLNKIDLSDAEKVAALLALYTEALQPAKTFTISALNGDNVAELCEAIITTLPEGPQYYPDDMIVDQPERFLVAEIVREKVLQLVREEVPHGVAVSVESMKENDKGMTVIESTIYVDRESPKRIVIGSNGSMLKQIGSLARSDIERLLGCKVYLQLWVKVREGWRNNEASLREFGYRK